MAASVPISDLSIVATPTEMFEKAESYRRANKVDSALIHYSLLVELNRKTDDDDIRRLVANSLLEIGRLYYIRLNDYANAYRSLQDAEEIAGSLGDKLMLRFFSTSVTYTICMNISFLTQDLMVEKCEVVDIMKRRFLKVWLQKNGDW